MLHLGLDIYIFCLYLWNREFQKRSFHFQLLTSYIRLSLVKISLGLCIITSTRLSSKSLRLEQPKLRRLCEMSVWMAVFHYSRDFLGFAVTEACDLHPHIFSIYSFALWFDGSYKQSTVKLKHKLYFASFVQTECLNHI